MLASPQLSSAADEVVRDPKRILSIPNVISFLRLATVPVFIWLFVADHTNAAVVLYAIGAWTDFLDGYLARRLNAVTDLGKLLDPLADRIFIIALAVALVWTDALPLWLALAIVGRDLLLVAAFPFVDKRAASRIPVTFLGKTATAALLAGLTLMAYAETTFPAISGIDEAGLGFVLFGAVLYWITAFQYAVQALALVRQPEGEATE